MSTGIINTSIMMIGEIFTVLHKFSDRGNCVRVFWNLPNFGGSGTKYIVVLGRSTDEGNFG